MFCKKCVLQNFAKFTGKHLRQSLFQALGLQLYSKRDSDANVFCEFCKNFKNPFLYKKHPVAASAKHLSVCTTTSHTTNRSSLSEGFFEKDVLKICSKVTGEHPCRSAISIKLLCNFIEISLRHSCSPVNFAAYLFLRTRLDGCFWTNKIRFSCE